MIAINSHEICEKARTRSHILEEIKLLEALHKSSLRKVDYEKLQEAYARLYILDVQTIRQQMMFDRQKVNLGKA